MMFLLGLLLKYSGKLLYWGIGAEQFHAIRFLDTFYWFGQFTFYWWILVGGLYGLLRYLFEHGRIRKAYQLIRMFLCMIYLIPMTYLLGYCMFIFEYRWPMLAWGLPDKTSFLFPYFILGLIVLLLLAILGLHTTHLTAFYIIYGGIITIIIIGVSTKIYALLGGFLSGVSASLIGFIANHFWQGIHPVNFWFHLGVAVGGGGGFLFGFIVGIWFLIKFSGTDGFPFIWNNILIRIPTSGLLMLLLGILYRYTADILIWAMGTEKFYSFRLLRLFDWIGQMNFYWWILIGAIYGLLHYLFIIGVIHKSYRIIRTIFLIFYKGTLAFPIGCSLFLLEYRWPNSLWGLSGKLLWIASFWPYFFIFSVLIGIGLRYHKPETLFPQAISMYIDIPIIVNFICKSCALLFGFLFGGFAWVLGSIFELIGRGHNFNTSWFQIMFIIFGNIGFFIGLQLSITLFGKISERYLAEP